MLETLHILFWIGAFVAVYSYLLYPLLLYVPKSRTKANILPDSLECWPTVSIIIPVYNAEDSISRKIQSTLALEYAPNLVQIIVVSDGSTDRTDEVAQSYEDSGVRLLRTEIRCGKEAAQKLAISEATGEILVFTDVGTETPPDSMRQLVAAFGVKNVGAASSEDRFITADGQPAGEGAYVRFEMWLRHLESERATLVGLSGSFFAARREVCRYWDTGVPSDFGVAIECVRSGFRAVSVPSAHGIYRDVSGPSKEYERKVRTITRGMRGLIRKKAMLNPLRFGFFSIQLFSHKVMRWAMPLGLLLLLLSSFWLASISGFFAVIFYLQIAAYFMALAPLLIPALARVSIFRIANYVLIVNVAILHALTLVIFGRDMRVWEPTKRQAS
jgi:cellulose synthase/poly-beta-1,6-N-acetylglucosamine synthase-like glycosyltransferase